MLLPGQGVGDGEQGPPSLRPGKEEDRNKAEGQYSHGKEGGAIGEWATTRVCCLGFKIKPKVLMQRLNKINRFKLFVNVQTQGTY